MVMPEVREDFDFRFELLDLFSRGVFALEFFDCRRAVKVCLVDNAPGALAYGLPIGHIASANFPAVPCWGFRGRGNGRGFSWFRV